MTMTVPMMIMMYDYVDINNNIKGATGVADGTFE